MTPDERSEIRRKALLAASSVTLALWMPGCAPKSDDDPTDWLGDTDARDTDGGSDTDAAGDTDQADTSLLADTDTVVADTDPVVVDTDTLIGDTAFTVDPSGPKPDCGALGLQLGACCNALVDWCTANVVAGTASQDYTDCVYGPTFDGSTGCIPWGPPVPPAASLA